MTLDPRLVALGFTLTDDGALKGPSIAHMYDRIGEQGYAYRAPAGPTGSAKDCTIRFRGDRVFIMAPDGQEIEVTGVRMVHIELMVVSGPGKVGIIL